MSENLPPWLPDLILFENYKGNWIAYINAIHEYFRNDFSEGRPSFRKAPVFARYHPPFEKKGATFWHLVSEGSNESERIPDFRRCERIRWPKSIIENANSVEVKVWETIRPWKNQKQRRINFALKDFSYIVVIAETRKGFDLITAYCVEKLAKREKLRKEFEIFQAKKEGSAV